MARGVWGVSTHLPSFPRCTRRNHNYIITGAADGAGGMGGVHPSFIFPALHAP